VFFLFPTLLAAAEVVELLDVDEEITPTVLTTTTDPLGDFIAPFFVVLFTRGDCVGVVGLEDGGEMYNSPLELSGNRS
jgi:hypothetical protein